MGGWWPVFLRLLGLEAGPVAAAEVVTLDPVELTLAADYPILTLDSSTVAMTLTADFPTLTLDCMGVDG